MRWFGITPTFCRHGLFGSVYWVHSLARLWVRKVFPKKIWQNTGSLKKNSSILGILPAYLIILFTILLNPERVIGCFGQEFFYIQSWSCEEDTGLLKNYEKRRRWHPGSYIRQNPVLLPPPTAMPWSGSDVSTMRVAVCIILQMGSGMAAQMGFLFFLLSEPGFHLSASYNVRQTNILTASTAYVEM